MSEPAKFHPLTGERLNPSASEKTPVAPVEPVAEVPETAPSKKK